MICHTCGRCTRCNAYVGHPCCGHAHHYCTNQQWYWNGFQYVVRPYWSVNTAHVHGAVHSHTHHHHHHHAHGPVRLDAGMAVQALSGRK